MTKHNLKDFKNLLVLNQNELGAYLNTLLNERRAFADYELTSSDGVYLLTPRYAEKYPLLCVHLDTINDHAKKPRPPRDGDLNVTFDFVRLNENAPCTCLGGDDRCGLWIALELINACTPFAFAFFTDEEIGCLGSKKAAGEICKDPKITAFIGLDRRGFNDVALYGYDNDALTGIFTDCGFIEAYGSVTDASTLASLDPLNRACVNLSVGYENEHHHDETINLTAMARTLEVLKGFELQDALSKEIFNAFLTEKSWADYENLWGYYSYSVGSKNSAKNPLGYTQDDLDEAYYAGYDEGYKDALQDREKELDCEWL